MSVSLGGTTHYTEDSEEYDPIQDIEVGDVTSFRDIGFQSEEMKNLLRLEEYTDDDKYNSKIAYSADHMFPGWILENAEWLSTEGKNRENKVSEVLQTPFNQRSQEQTSTLIHWLMSVWETANLMGFKRCGAMTKVFHFLTYDPGENIITEGERGLTFYIVISGDCNVYKEGIGKVAALTKGQSFGEIALTQGKDLRSATVQAVTEVEVLRLHKVDYDHFVKDIQLAERRENLQVLKSCKLFDQWSRAKIQKMVTTCLRRSYNAGDVIFHQGDVPDNIYFIVEGTVTIVKEIHIVVRNRWPVAVGAWDGVAKKKIKPVVVNQLTRGAYFGELSIIKNKNRTATARAKTRCIVLCLDKLEFVHLLRSGKTMETVSNFVTDYQNDIDILNTVADLRGGPSTTAQLNEYVKTAEIGSRPSSPAKRGHAPVVHTVQPTAANKTDVLAQISRPNKRPTGILRIPTKVYEKVGPNNGVPKAKKRRAKPTFVVKETTKTKELIKIAKERKTDTGQTSSDEEKRKPTLKGLSRTIASFQELNQTSMSSVTKFRKQLSLANSAVKSNGANLIPDLVGGGPPGGSPGPVRVDAHPRVKENKKQQKQYEPPPTAITDTGGGAVDHLRTVMEGLVVANRKLHYLDDNSALQQFTAFTAKNLEAKHRALKFESPSYTSSLSAGSVRDRSGRGGPRASTAPEGFATAASAEEKGSSTTFQLKPDLFGRKRGISTSISTAPKRVPNPQLDFGECKAQPMLMAVNKVVMESSTGRKSRSDFAQDIEEFVEATKRGDRPPSREILTRSTSRDLLRSPSFADRSPPRPSSKHTPRDGGGGGAPYSYSRQSSSPLSRQNSAL